MKRLILIFLSVFAIHAFAQFENKLTASAFLAIPKYTPENGGATFQNVFNGYKAIPFVGGGIDYSFNTHMSIGGNVKLMFPSKDFHSIINTNLGVSLKYNILPNDKPVSPFIYTELNFSHIILEIKGYDASFTSVEAPDRIEGNVTPYNYEYSISPSQTLLSPVLGYMIGVGTDFTMMKKVGIWVSINYMATDAHNHAEVAINYPDNISKYSFFVLKLGVKFGFLQSKSLL